MSTSSRTRGSSMPAIVSIAAARCGRVRRLLTLDLLVEHEVEFVQHGKQPTQQRLACLADRQPHSRRPDPARGVQLGEQELEPLGLGAPSGGADPVVQARPDDAHAAAHRVETCAQRVDLGIRCRRERPPQLPGLQLDHRRDTVRDDADGDVGCRALGADHVGRPVECGCRQRPARRQTFVSIRRRCGRPERDHSRPGRMRRHSVSAIARRGTGGRAAHPVQSADTG